ncbi:MAG: hypothetical protein NDF56_02450 [archaeon GB-1845-036]|nr:hypothetical protein [Candidatus Culexmicrobium thermophilum]HDO20909.1 hypothetical protein [Candidatus Bathyarchaeota archaeon]
MTYIYPLGVLLSDDAFDSFSIPISIFDVEGEASRIMQYARKHLVSIVGKYRKNIIENVGKILRIGLKVKVIVPPHGLVWKNNPNMILDAYMRWAEEKPVKIKS